ncbi:mitochondrial adenyl nucleotide antiporter SLC25A24-like [Rhopilema esculentum]|uniref:mitochondrial adenyl nucleotide antiporter SLC25A24-like n=1 Tax=Rhopilema esculentum TaxID=499914 RepID=UPI0031DA7F77|eukprot:gene10523-19248_t
MAAEAGKSDHYADYKFDRARIAKLFSELDANKDGKIDVTELSEGLKRLGVKHIPGSAEKIIELGDKTDDDHLTLDEFLRYCMDHEKKLWLVFKSIDTNNSGTVTNNELRAAFHRLGVEVEDEEIASLMKHMDTDGSLQVEWKEWRDYHFLNPHSHNITDILKFWKHSMNIDIGENMVIPDEFTEEEKVTGKWWRQLVAGACAGVVSRTFTAPLDRLKVLLQVQAGSKASMGVKSGFQEMLREGGIKSLWRGNGVNVLKIAPESAIKFMAYERIKKLFKEDGTKLNVGERLLSGSMAGVVSQTTIYPMEVLKTRLAIGKTGQYNGMVHAAKTIFVNEGIRSFYKGLTPGLIGIIPYAGIDLAIYETLKTTWLNRHGKESTDPGVLVLLLCGTASSTCGQLASYPLALIRTKLQAQAQNQSPTQNQVGMMSVLRTIVKENGFFGLYRGLTPNIMKVAPAVSIGYVVYEQLKKWLGLA